MHVHELLYEILHIWVKIEKYNGRIAIMLHSMQAALLNIIFNQNYLHSTLGPIAAPHIPYYKSKQFNSHLSLWNSYVYISLSAWSFMRKEYT